MERNFLEIYFGKYKKYWSQKPPERGPRLGTH
jgi:hypothetical protein